MNTNKPVKILVTRQLPKELCLEFKQTHPQLQLVCTSTDVPLEENELLSMTRAEEPDGIVVTLTEQCSADFVFNLPESVKAISTIAVGTDNIDLNACKERGINVYNTPDVLTEATADLTWTLILAASRRLIEGHKMCVNNQFKGWSPTLLMGKELNGATLGIVGLGRIGRSVAKRACGFGMKIIYNNRKPIDDIEDMFPGNAGGSLPEYVTIDDLCKRADVISLHCPLNKDSFHLFNEARLQTCKVDAVLVNMSRGAVINEDALIKTLKQGHFMGVGLDVYEKEPQIHHALKKIDRVVLLPHIGSATRTTRWKMMRMSINAILKNN
ncbi:MAG: 2-hydroxyacid dehydrogenase [Candidatus Anammoxibacter sp.]